MGDWVVQFDCAEAVYARDCTREQAEAMRDDFGCVPRSVTPAEECDLDHAWEKNGWLRVQLRVAQ